MRFIWILHQVNQLSLSINSAYTLANETQIAFNSFKNNADNSFISVSTYMYNKIGDQIYRTIIKDHVYVFSLLSLVSIYI